MYGNGVPCNAPSNNMYFTVRGNVAPCWKLPGMCDKWSEERSIKDIWNGDKFQMYRDALSEERNR
jgi:radical SAM protein with 4Fe4S-binding SPASM domain